MHSKKKNRIFSTSFQLWKMIMKIRILRSLTRLFMIFVSLMKIRFELKISFTLFSTQFYLVVFCTVGATSEMVYKFCPRVTIWKGGGLRIWRFIELAQKYSTFFPDSWRKGQFKKKSWNRDIFIDKLIPKENSCFDFAFKNDDLHNLNIVVFTLWLDVFWRKFWVLR